MFILQLLASVNTKTNIWKTINDMKASVKCGVIEELPVMDRFQMAAFEKIKGSIGQVSVYLFLIYIIFTSGFCECAEFDFLITNQ